MGFARNLGAYATFGLVPTTNHKKTEREYEERRQRHQNQLAVYNDVLNDVREAVDAMMAALWRGARSSARHRRAADD